MIELKELLQDSVLDERIVYHGTISDFVDKIKSSGKLKSVQAGAQKVSGGFLTEKGLIWVTPNFDIANYYADGIESRHEYNIERGLKANYGGVFEIEIDDNLKLIDRNTPLTKEQINILNSRFIPHYKPLNIGDTLSNAEWRSNGKQLHDMIKALGFDGVIYGKDQIGIVADELPIKVFHHKPNMKENKISLKSILKETIIALPFNVKSTGIGDFYIQMDGNNAGRPFKIKPEKGNYYAVTTNKNILMPEYFYYVVEYLYTSGAFKNVIHGTTVPHLNIKGFTETVVQFFFQKAK